MSRDSTGDTPVGRRALLGTIGVGSVAALAGCFGDDDDEVTQPDGSAAENAPAQSYDDVPIDELADFPDDSCEACAMRPADFPEWNAQLVHENGDRGFFCTPGCAVAYFTMPEAFGGPDAPVASFWMTGFETAEFIDAFEATYVLEHETGRIDQPMGRNPYPFENEDDAYGLVADYDHLEDEHVVTFEEVDEEVAKEYRHF